MTTSKFFRLALFACTLCMLGLLTSCSEELGIASETSVDKLSFFTSSNTETVLTSEIDLVALNKEINDIISNENFESDPHIASMGCQFLGATGHTRNLDFLSNIAYQYSPNSRARNNKFVLVNNRGEFLRGELTSGTSDGVTHTLNGIITSESVAFGYVGTGVILSGTDGRSIGINDNFTMSLIDGGGGGDLTNGNIRTVSRDCDDLVLGS